MDTLAVEHAGGCLLQILAVSLSPIDPVKSCTLTVDPEIQSTLSIVLVAEDMGCWTHGMLDTLVGQDICHSVALLDQDLSSWTCQHLDTSTAEVMRRWFYFQSDPSIKNPLADENMRCWTHRWTKTLSAAGNPHLNTTVTNIQTDQDTRNWTHSSIKTSAVGHTAEGRHG